jgi:zinc transporter ZupT
MIYVVEEVAHFIMVEGHSGHHHHHHNTTVARHNSIAHGITLPIENHHNKECDNSKNNIDLDSEASIEQCPDEEQSLASSIRAIIALIALSFHAVVEGVAIGIKVGIN